MASSSWDLDTPAVAGAFTAWRAMEAPSLALRVQVADWIFDRLLSDPLRAGRAELVEGYREVRLARVPGTGVSVLYVVDRALGSVAVASITGASGG